MFRRKLVLATTTVAVALLIATSPASATHLLDPIAIDRSGSLLGAQLSLTADGGTNVVFRLLTPRKADGRRDLWGTCRLPYLGKADYRCELDLVDASRRLQRGEWMIRVRVGDRIVARKPFRLA